MAAWQPAPPTGDGPPAGYPPATGYGPATYVGRYEPPPAPTGLYYPAPSWPVPAVVQGPTWAGSGIRLGAVVLDGVFLLASAIASVVLMDHVGYRQVGNEMVTSPAASMVESLWYVFLVVYHPVCWWCFRATVGQRLLRLRVVRAADGSRLSLGRTAVRYLVFAICAGTVVPALVAAWVANSQPSKQTWWDKVAKSVVVRGA